MENKKYEDIHIGMGEKLSYGLANIGGNMVYTTISSFATLYYTNSVGIAAATAGTMMLIARLFDGISDIFMGGIIDKTHTKMGQAKPWFMASIIPLILSLILVFSVPESFDYGAKVVYMYLTYIFSAVICYTANVLAAVAMQALMTGNLKERMKLNAIYQMMGFVIIIVLNMVTEKVYTSVGWQTMSYIYAAISAACLIIAGIVCKERKHNCVVEDVRVKTEKKVTFREGLPVLLKNKYFWIILILSIINYISIGTFNGGGIYFCMYVLGNGAMFGLMTLAGMGPTIICTAFVPQVAAKIGKRNTIALGYALQAVGFVITFMANSALPLIIAGLVLKGIGLAGVAGLLIPMIGDVIDYGEKQSGLRLDGLTNSVSSIGTKLGTGLGSALVGWVLAWGAYNGAAEVQVASALVSMRVLVGGIPAICGILGVVFSLMFNIEKDMKGE